MRSFVRIPSRAVPLLAAVALTACAPANRAATRVTGAEAIRATLDSAGLLAQAQEPGPEIRLRAEQEFGDPDNIDAVLRLDDDAYVMVVNVGPDGYARVVFPETPTDDGLLRGGRSYRLPSFFPGFATNASSALSMSGRFVPFRRSEFASVTAQGPGFVFAIASSRPMDLRLVEEFGMWDEFRLPQDGMLLDPRYIVKYYRDAALGEGRAYGVSAAVARYAGWVPAYSRLASASCVTPFGYGQRFNSVNWRTGYGFGAIPIWATTAMSYGSADANCGLRGFYAYNPWGFNFPPVGPIVAQQPQPTPPPVDSGAAQPGPKPETRPVGHPLDPLNPPVPGTPTVITDGQTIVLTPQARAMARREAMLERSRPAIEGAGGPRWMRRAGDAEGRPMPRGAGSSGTSGGRNGASTPLPGGARRAIEGAAGSGGSAMPAAPAPAATPAPAPGTRGAGQKPAEPPSR